MRRWILFLAVLGLPLAATTGAPAQQPRPQQQAQPPRQAQQQAPQPQQPPQQAQPQPQRQGGGPPHEWVFGVWTGGQFPAGEADTQACYAQATVIFLRDVVLRASALDIALRQRLVETVAVTPDGGLEFRFVPAAPLGGPFGGRAPPDAGFGCDGNPNVLRVERRGPDEIVFPGCTEFPSPLKRCTGGAAAR